MSKFKDSVELRLYDLEKECNLFEEEIYSLEKRLKALEKTKKKAKKA